MQNLGIFARPLKAEPPERLVSVYVIESPLGFVKVGMAANPAARLENLQTGSPGRLRLTYMSDPLPRSEARELERVAHMSLVNWAVLNEWFSCPAEVAEDIIFVCGGSAPVGREVRL